MRSLSSGHSLPLAAFARGLLLLTSACISWSGRARAAPSSLPPEVGYNYDEVETARVAGKNGADRALGSSIDALFTNPANMAASRTYHLGGIVQIWPEASRQSYGAAGVDSVGSSTGLAGGLGAVWTRQDPDGVDRTAIDLRFGLAYPFSEKFFAGASGRYLQLSENGDGPLGASYASGGLADAKIVRAFSLDLGVTLKPGGGLALSAVGNNLTSSEHGFQPLTLGGGVGWGNDNFALETDLVADLSTWDDTKLRAMVGLDALLADHIGLRGGYRFDAGAESHSASVGLGYLDKAFSVDGALRRVFSGDTATAIVLTFTFHLDATGLMATPNDTF